MNKFVKTITYLTTAIIATSCQQTVDSTVNSICGSSDLVYVEAFESNENFSKEFIAEKSRSVAVLIETMNKKIHPTKTKRFLLRHNDFRGSYDNR